MNAPAYKGSALRDQRVTVRTTSIECGCGRRYSPAQFAALTGGGKQDVGGGTYLMLRNCSACGSTIAMPWCGTDGCSCADVLNHGFEGPANADFAGEGR